MILVDYRTLRIYRKIKRKYKMDTSTRFLNIIFQLRDLQLLLWKLRSTLLFSKWCCFARAWVFFPPLDVSVILHRGQKQSTTMPSFPNPASGPKHADNCSHIGQGEKIEITQSMSSLPPTKQFKHTIFQ